MKWIRNTKQNEYNEKIKGNWSTSNLQQSSYRIFILQIFSGNFECSVYSNATLGWKDGIIVGTANGCGEGKELGWIVGIIVGRLIGCFVGCCDGW